MQSVFSRILALAEKQLVSASVDEAIRPILRLLERIPNSREFTRLPPLFDASENFPITEMYVELMVARTRGVAQPLLLQQGRTIAEEQEARYKRHLSRHLNIHHCIDMPQHQHLVVLGDPGSGKTSLLKYLCLEIATGKNQRWSIPVFISLRRYWLEKQKNTAMTLLHYAATTLFVQKQSVQHFEAVLRQLTGDKKEHILFLLDGLDEIATHQEAIETVTQDIRQLGLSFSWVLTSRHTGFFGDVDEDICYDIVNLNKAGIEELIDSWFRNTQIAHKTADKRALLAQIEANPRLKDMASNPFLLTLLCHIQQSDIDSHLPLHRSDVYAKIIQLIRLQLRNIKKDNQLFREQELGYLSRFCHYLYTAVELAPLQIFEYDHWDTFSYPAIPPDFDKHFLPSRLINSFRQGGDFHFLHLTFQEYLIALHCSKQELKEVSNYIFSPHWKMVFRFLAGIYSKQATQENLKKLLLTLLEPVDQLGILYLEVANFLIEANIEDSTLLLGYDIRENLWSLWLEKSEYVKENAGELLAILSPCFVLSKITDLLNTDVNPKKSYNTWRSVKLLGFINTAEADTLIINLLQDEDQHVRSMAIAALAEKNTTHLRQAVIELYQHNPVKYFHLLCAVARDTKHHCFISYLTPYLLIKPENINEYSGLFQAFTALGSGVISQSLINFTHFYRDEELSDEMFESIVSAQTAECLQWLEVKFLVTDSAFRRSLLYQAIVHNILPKETLLKLLDTEDETSLYAYLNAIIHYVQNGNNLNNAITYRLVQIANEPTDIGARAFTVLEQSKFKENLDAETLWELLDLARYYAEDSDIELAIAGISILGKFNDIDSYSLIKKLALTGNKNGVQSTAIATLVKYQNHYLADIKETLHGLYAELKNTNSYITRDILMALAEIDLQEIVPYWNDTITREAITTFCAQEGTLLFDDCYIDRLGKRHYFTSPPPQLNANIPAYEQLDSLRLACQYAIDQGLVRKTSAKKNTIPPLFTKYQAGINENTFEHGVDVATGNKFLKGQKIHESSATAIMHRLKELVPMLFLYSEK